MRITNFRVRNYKSFFDSEDIVFRPGFNVIVGRNNVGKTALLQALGLQAGSVPHKSFRTSPSSGIPALGPSLFTVTFELGKTEMLNLMRYQIGSFWLPERDNLSPREAINTFKTRVGDPICVEAIFADGNIQEANIIGYYDSEQLPSMMVQIGYSAEEMIATGRQGIQKSALLPAPLANVLRQKIYTFRAERFGIGQSEIGPISVLNSDGSNLPQVLHHLSTSNPPQFQEYMHAIRDIFPEITLITIPPISNSSAQILLWGTDPADQRADLAIPLSESGTGVGQVMAILYVVLTSRLPQTIIIDEPQSFLHPGAIRKLFELMLGFARRYQHQYIITSHSPLALMSAEPQALILVRKREGESVVEEVDATKTQQQQLFLTEIGASLSDLFGVDRVLWVEGPTEARAFQAIISELMQRPLAGTAVLSVVATGDLDKKGPTSVWAIYERLSTGAGVIPPAIGFIFDRELRSERNHRRIESDSRHLISFTTRRMYENYLLKIEAIAAVMDSLPGFRPTPVTSQEIQSWLDTHAWDEKYFSRLPREEERIPELWVTEVHAADILSDLFTHFSETRYYYEKVEYGLTLTRWLIENAPAELQEIVELLESKMDAPQQE